MILLPNKVTRTRELRKKEIKTLILGFRSLGYEDKAIVRVLLRGQRLLISQAFEELEG